MPSGMTEVARATVTIIPNMQGAQQTIASELGAASESSGKSAGEKAGSAFSANMGTALKAGVDVVMDTVGAAMKSVGAMAKEAFSNFADYQQLTGGIETLFGTGGQTMQDMVDAAKAAGESTKGIIDKYKELNEAQDLVMANASNAWKTAGLNVNEYMETVTSFAASLKQSTSSNIEAAKAADVAVQDMADNSAKMGTSMESIMAAYAGFSKGQFTLLDNLRIGYGGTKTEAERLLKDAEKLTGQKYDINNLADVYDAIHVIQTEMGITGTTAQEAMFTISGSAAATKSAWENVLTAIGGGGDLREAMNGLTKAIFGDSNGGGLLANVLPQLQTAFEGIGEFVSTAAPIISEKIPVLIDSLLPVVVDSVSVLLESVVDALPGLLESLGKVGETVISKVTEMLPKLLQTGIDLVVMLADGITKAIPKLLPTLVKLVLDVGQMLVDNAPKLLSAALELVKTLAENIASNAVNLVTGAIALISQLEVFIIENLPMIIKTAGEIVMALVEGLTSPEAINQLVDAYLEMADAFIDAVIDNLPEILEAGILMLGALGEGLIKAIPELLMIVPKIYKKLFDKLILMDWKSIGRNIINGIKEGVLKAKDTLLKAFQDLCTEAWGKVKDFFGIKSPSRLMAYAGRMIGQGLVKGIEGEESAVDRAMTRLSNVTFGSFTPALAVAGDMGGAGSSSIVNTITVNGASDPELWAQGFIRTINRQERMLNG